MAMTWLACHNVAEVCLHTKWALRLFKWCPLVALIEFVGVQINTYHHGASWLYGVVQVQHVLKHVP
jgi:hypothetical protein